MVQETSAIAVPFRRASVRVGILNASPLASRCSAEFLIGREESQRGQPKREPPHMDLHGGGELHGIIAAQAMSLG